MNLDQLTGRAMDRLLASGASRPWNIAGHNAVNRILYRRQLPGPKAAFTWRLAVPLHLSNLT